MLAKDINKILNSMSESEFSSVVMRLTEYRHSLNLTQAEFAKILHVGQSYLSQIEKGLYRSIGKPLTRLCVNPHPPVEFFLYGNEPDADNSTAIKLLSSFSDNYKLTSSEIDFIIKFACSCKKDRKAIMLFFSKKN